MTNLYERMMRYNPGLTREGYQSLIDILRAERDLAYGTAFISEVVVH